MFVLLLVGRWAFPRFLEVRKCFTLSILCFWLMKPGPKHLSEQLHLPDKLLPVDPVTSIIILHKIPHLPSYWLPLLCPTAGLPRLLVTSDMNQSSSKNDNLFALISEKSGGSGAGFQAQVDWGPYTVSAGISLSLFSPCSGRFWFPFQHHCQPCFMHMPSSVLVYTGRLL